MKLIENILFWLGCHWLGVFVSGFLLFIALLPTQGMYAFILFILMALVSLFTFVHFQHFAPARLQAYREMLIAAAKKKLLDEDKTPFKPYVLLKKGKACNRFLKPRMTYAVSIVYLTESYMVITTDCPEYNLYGLQREDIKKKWAIKTNCKSNKEFYYEYIQSVHFEGGKVVIILTSGDIESIASEKKEGDALVGALRKKLREIGRGVQLNPIKT